MKWMQYVFYRIFSLYRRKHDDGESAIIAMMFVSLLMFMNIFAIGAILYNFKLLPLFFSLPSQGTIFIFGLFALNYFLFIYKNRYVRFVQKFEQNSLLKRKKGWLIVLHIILSAALLYAIPFVKPGLI